MSEPIRGYPERDILRATRAVILGEEADRLVAQECRRLGLDPTLVLSAPLTWIGMAGTESEGEA